MNEIFLESEYAEIIIALINEPYNINSIIKIIFMAFCIRNETKSSYRNKKTDFVDELLNNINIKLFSHPDEFKCIFEVLNKLKKCGWIKVNDGNIVIVKNFRDFKCENKFLNNYIEKDINPLTEVNKLDDKAFLEEVLRHV